MISSCPSADGHDQLLSAFRLLLSAFCLLCQSPHEALGRKAHGAIVMDRTGFQGYKSACQRGPSLVIVSREHHSLSLSGKAAHHLFESAHCGGVETIEWFVQ